METTNASNAPATILPASVLALTIREVYELLRRLHGGKAGFDYGQYKKAELLAVIEGWITTGPATAAATIDAHARAVLDTRNAAARATPPMPLTLAAAAPAALTMPQPAAPSPVVMLGDNAPGPDGESLRASILAAIELTTPQPAAPSLPQHVPDAIVPIPGPAIMTPAILAPATLPDGTPGYDSADEAAAIAAALASTAATHPAALLPPMDDAPLSATQQKAAPAGREYARHLFRDCPAALVQAIPARLHVPYFAHPEAEAIDGSYRFNAATLVPCLIAMAATPTLRVWAGGPRGTGKTEFARQMAARTGRALYRVNFNRFTEASEIVGDVGLVIDEKTGQPVTRWVDGPVAAACRVQDGAALLLLDEITYGTPGALSCLNPLLERGGAILRLPRAAGAALAIPDGLFVLAADNTFGNGDASGQYAARNPLGADTLDRFNVKLAFDYLSTADERALLAAAVRKETGGVAGKDTLNALLKVMHVAREKAGMGELQGAPSFRGAVTCAVLMAGGMTPADAYRLAVIQGAPEESHEALRTIFVSHWPTDAQGGLVSFMEGI